MPQPNTPEELDSFPRWHFAVGGLETQQDTLRLGDAIRLCRLRQFPTHEQLTLSLNSLPVALVMALYGEEVIRHELIIDAERIDDPGLIPRTAGAILAGLRIRTGSEIVCPAVCEHSWGALPMAPPHGCRAYHFERGLSQQIAIQSRLLSPDDLDWVRKNLATVVLLTENENFQTAVEALCTYTLAATDRMRAAQLWAGVEALFGRRLGEIGYRLRVLTAMLIEDRGPARRTHYRRFRRLYNTRCNVVHGGRVEPHELCAHLVEVRDLLARLLRRVIFLRKVPTDDDFEELLCER
jgi:hypothetical protein